MKNGLKKHIALILALIIISGVCLLFAGRKEGLFIDEIYTYGLSNSFYAPYVTDIKGGSLIDKVMTRQELLDYLTVGADDRFAAGSVYYNQTRDVHPPLYYWLFNFVSSLDAGEFSFRAGLILNYIIYMAALVILYRLCLLLFDSRLNAVCAVLLYGLSTLGLSTMLMLRMYVLMMLLTLILAYLIALIMRAPRPIYYPLVGLTILAGLMTQYYFVFGAFFMCLAYDIYALVKRDFKGFALFSASAILGALCLLAAFPACIDQLFSGALVSGESAVDNLFNLAQYPVRLRAFIADTAHRMKGVIYVTVILVLAAGLSVRKIAESARARRISLTSLVLIIPAGISFALIAVISPVSEIRYIYSLVPLLILADCLLLHLVEESDTAMNTMHSMKLFFGVAVAVLCLWEARCLPPDYLYDEYSDYDAMLEEYQDAPCIYFDDNYFSPITYDMLQLMIFDDFFVTNDADSAPMREYIGSAEELILFVDISKEWASGYDADEVIAAVGASTGLTRPERLYSNGFSAVYVLKGGDA